MATSSEVEAYAMAWYHALSTRREPIIDFPVPVDPSSGRLNHVRRKRAGPGFAGMLCDIEQTQGLSPSGRHC